MQLAHPQTSYFMANSRARRRRDAVSLALEQLLRLFSEGTGDTALHSGRGPERGVQPRPPVSRACISLATPASGHGGVFRGARKAPREGARARAVPTPFTLLRDSLTPPGSERRAAPSRAPASSHRRLPGARVPVSAGARGLRGWADSRPWPRERLSLKCVWVLLPFHLSRSRSPIS